MSAADNVWAAPRSPHDGPAEGLIPPSPYPPTAPPPGAPAPARRRRLPVWAIVLIVIGGLFVATFSLAAVGSQLRQQQGVDIWEATHYVFPDRIDGQTHTDTTATQQWAQTTKKQLDKGLTTYDVQATTYGDPEQPSIAVLTARPNHSLNGTMQRLINASNAKGLKPGQTAKVSEPGPLGGTLTCGVRDAALLCTVVDEAGQMVILMPADAGSAAQALRVRSLVEIRH